MTENEAIEELREQIETAESMISFNMDFEPKHDNSVLENKIKTAKIAISALEEIQQYRAIGTVEECRKARERQMRKKVNNRKLLRDFNKTPYSVRGDCPNCGSVGLLSMNTDYCNACGQKLDWSE